MGYMQEGIGRSGYRVLALVFFGLAVLGLAISLYQFSPAAGLFDWLGFALTALAVTALLTLSLVILARTPTRAATAPPEPAPVVQEAQLAPIPDAVDPSADLGVEYEDEPRLEQGPIDTTPPEQPRAPIVVPPRKPRGDTKGWPERRDPSGVTRGEMLKRQRAPPPTARSQGREPPLVMARTAASAEATGIPDNATLGKCGNCNVLLIAPKRRPIRLQCPRCERVHALT